MSDDLNAFLPLEPRAFEILLALTDGDRHGYAILKVLESRGVPLAASLLYRKIRRMMQQGLIAGSEARPDPGDDARRRYYRLTSLGRTVVRAEAARIVQLAATRSLRKLARDDEGGRV